MLSGKENPELIIAFLKELSEMDLIRKYAFVIMPNHEYFIWEQINKNGIKQHRQLLKYTTHEFLKNLKEIGESEKYEGNAFNKKHEIWQRDILSVEIYSREFVSQKLEYIHFNSVRGNWSLSKDDMD